MAENSKIEWTDHTFNPWIGCTKVHAGCAHCYAEAMMDSRWGKVQWGPNGTRVATSIENWAKPLSWDRAAKKAGRPALVFCASLADVFEDWAGAVEIPSEKMRTNGLEALRLLLFRLIDETPNLIWLMLTKRPENVRRMWPCYSTLPHKQWRENVWLGTSPCNQETADKACRALYGLQGLCGGTFLSCEPLLGPVHLATKPDWVIVGGESGHKARPMNPEWVEMLRLQCQEQGVPFFLKQWGDWKPRYVSEDDGCACGRDHNDEPCNRVHFWSYCGGGPAGYEARNCLVSVNVGKKAAGRSLHGQEYREFPTSFQRAELVATA